MIATRTVVQVSEVVQCPIQNSLIEATTAIVVLPDHNKLQLTLLYRSHSEPIRTLMATLLGILELLDSNIPSIILGDFNVDLLSEHNMQILMSSHGYSQLVDTPTTDNGTLLDHSNQPSNSHEVHVIDTYYSDHDVVLYSLA